MIELSDVIDPTTASAVGWALVHFVWQGALVALALASVRSALVNASPVTRYGVACGALFVMAVLPPVTVVYLSSSGASPVSTALVAPVAAAPTATVAAASRLDGWSPESIEPALPWVVVVWLAGVVVFSLRFAFELRGARRLRRRAHPAPAAWQRACDDVARTLRLRQSVRLCVSFAAEVPAVIGWLRPIVLVPSGVFLGLDGRQLEAILAHELAHVRRYDYLVNLGQNLVETLYFYHPGVWWVSRVIRDEREQCCDDVAVAACGDVVVYATALADLEDLRGGAGRLAVAATGGPLVRRVARLLGRQPVRGSSQVGAGALLALAVVAAAFAAGPTRASHVPPAPPVPSAAPAPPASVAPSAPAMPALPAPLAPPAPPAPGVPASLAAPPAPPAPPSDGDETPEQAAFRVHGVTPEFVQSLAELGYIGLSGEQLVECRVHGVDADFIRELRDVGFEGLSIEQLVAGRVHGVTGAYVRSLRESGYDVAWNDVIAGRVHGLADGEARAWTELGYGRVPYDRLIAFRVHGVTLDFARDLRALGYTPTIDQLVAMRVFGITTEFVRDVVQRDGAIPIDRLIRMRTRGEV